jgi:antitoxin component of MazEF toxin-antitoxin module
MLRKIISLGKYSGVISLPKELMKKVGLRRGQKVEIKSTGKTIQVKDAK